MNNEKKAIPFVFLIFLSTVVVVMFTFYKTVILDDYVSFESPEEEEEVIEIEE